MVAWQA